MKTTKILLTVVALIMFTAISIDNVQCADTSSSVKQGSSQSSAEVKKSSTDEEILKELKRSNELKEKEMKHNKEVEDKYRNKAKIETHYVLWSLSVIGIMAGAIFIFG